MRRGALGGRMDGLRWVLGSSVLQNTKLISHAARHAADGATESAMHAGTLAVCVQLAQHRPRHYVFLRRPEVLTGEGARWWCAMVARA